MQKHADNWFNDMFTARNFREGLDWNMLGEEAYKSAKRIARPVVRPFLEDLKRQGEDASRRIVRAGAEEAERRLKEAAPQVQQYVQDTARAAVNASADTVKERAPDVVANVAPVVNQQISNAASSATDTAINRIKEFVSAPHGYATLGGAGLGGILGYLLTRKKNGGINTLGTLLGSGLGALGGYYLYDRFGKNASYTEVQQMRKTAGYLQNMANGWNVLTHPINNWNDWGRTLWKQRSAADQAPKLNPSTATKMPANSNWNYRKQVLQNIR